MLEFFSHYKYIKYHKLGLEWKKSCQLIYFSFKNIFNLSYCVDLIIYLVGNFYIMQSKKKHQLHILISTAVKILRYQVPQSSCKRISLHDEEFWILFQN